MATMVYRYGLLRPDVNADLVASQMRAAHRAYNDILQIRRDEWETKSALQLDKSSRLRAAVDERDAAKERLKELRTRIKALLGHRPEKGDARNLYSVELRGLQEQAKIVNKVEIPRMKAAVADARADVRSDAEYTALREAIEQKANAKKLELYSRMVSTDKAIFWPTWNIVAASVDQAMEMSLKYGVLPGFQRWKGEGQIGMQIQGKAPASSLFDGDTRIQIDPVDARAWMESTPRGERRRLSRTRLRVRIGSNGRAPIWAEWPMVMHRGFPRGAIISGCTVNRWMAADRDVWSVQITVDVPDTVREDINERVIALDLGWRHHRDGDLRMAYWRDNAGGDGEVLMPVSIRERLDLANRIRGYRDKNQDELQVWLISVFRDRASLPHELREYIVALHQWEAPAKYVSLWKRFGDLLTPEVNARLEAWCHRDRHLWQYEVGARQGAIRCRNDAYWCYAKELSQKYDAVVIEKFDLRRVIEKPPVEERKEKEDLKARREKEAQKNRVCGAPSKLRDRIRVSMGSGRANKRVIEVDAAYTTMIHNKCGRKVTQLNPAVLMHYCEHCDETYDQDDNAAKNIIARGLEIVGDRGALAALDALKIQRKAKWAARHKAKIAA